MQVRQMSISYVVEQDRILVRVNTSEERELQFWCTRRLTLGLAPLLERIATQAAAHRGGPATTHLATADAVTQKAMSDFTRNETIRRADFSTPYRVADTSAPLFASPLVLTEVNIASLAGGAMRLQCAEKLGDAASRTFELVLSETLAHAFMHLLAKAVAASSWRCAPAAESGAGATTGTPRASGYLN